MISSKPHKIEKLAIISLLCLSLFNPVSAQSENPPSNLVKPDRHNIEQFPLSINEFGSSQNTESGNVISDPWKWTRFVFQSYRYGNWEVIFREVNSNQEVNITNSSVPDFQPRLNNNGDRIVFTSNRPSVPIIVRHISPGNK